MASRLRIACFIDGFNLYHALDELGKDHLRWLDYWKLAEAFKIPSQEKLISVYYFSAYPTWMHPDKLLRHRNFVGALRSIGVRDVMGKFKETSRACPKCHHKWRGHEEKETDVQIGIHLVRGVCRAEFDKALLISADSDLVPAVKMCRDLDPQIPIELLVPPGRANRSRDLQQCVTRWRKIKLKHLANNLLPPVVRIDGDTEIKRPSKYDP